MSVIALAEGFDLSSVADTIASSATSAVGTGVVAVVPVIAAIVGVKIVISLVKKNAKG